MCGFSFCLPAPTAEKMATDVFFRDGSTIKEALVAFLMRHVNFIKCGVEERGSRPLQPRKAKCLFAFNFDKAVFAPVYLTSPPLTPSSVDQGRSRSIQPEGPMSGRMCGFQSSTGEEKKKKTKEKQRGNQGAGIYEGPDMATV